ncbi:dUTPase [Gordonia phage GMA2]|uniref:Putative dUTPase n=1 Tax=Gordonia phage GMA2 TaxID=1647283 RepID=A0A0K0N6X8_9CAUD|nr:dUTPase [Gordonia phage GMA2]AKJ72590.1 putative dUTPase [Gordonia phage GMA2]
MTIRPNTWLEETADLQRDYFNNEPAKKEGEERADYVRTQILAATAELHEMLDEMNWKPWSTDPAGEFKNREAFISEAVDACHFIANALLAARATDKEYWEAYNNKMQRNRERMAKEGGYEASKNKCPNCRRELDRDGAYEINLIRGSHGVPVLVRLHCLACDHTFTHNASVSLPNGEVIAEL